MTDKNKHKLVNICDSIGIIGIVLILTLVLIFLINATMTDIIYLIPLSIVGIIIGNRITSIVIVDPYDLQQCQEQKYKIKNKLLKESNNKLLKTIELQKKTIELQKKLKNIKAL